VIPKKIHLAFKGGRRVRTLAGTGRMKRCRLADLVLPTGRIATGYPCDYSYNKPNKLIFSVEPGAYPVFINIVKKKGGFGAFAFVSVIISDEKTTKWENAGNFFTDSGDGCIYDEGVVDLIRERIESMSREEWQELKAEAFQGGRGDLKLDEETGANAIVFRAGDWDFQCYIGLDKNDQPTSFIIDGRV
jgi:hypothetical protein